MTFHRTRWVTFPRSGHHWAVRLVQHALPDIVYDEHYTTGKTLENSPEIHLQKTHDFDLAAPVSSEFRHIVQVRDFVKSMESWKRVFEELKIPEWREQDMLDHYKGFITKWVINHVPNRLIVHYGDLMEWTPAFLSEIIEHVCDIPTSESTRLAIEAVKSEPPKKKE